MGQEGGFSQAILIHILIPTLRSNQVWPVAWPTSQSVLLS